MWLISGEVSERALAPVNRWDVNEQNSQPRGLQNRQRWGNWPSFKATVSIPGWRGGRWRGGSWKGGC